MRQGGVEILWEDSIVLFKQRSNLGPQDGIELVCANVFVTFDTFLKLVDNLQGSLYSNIGSDKCLLKVIENTVVDGRFTQDTLGELGKEAFFGLGETLVKGLLLFFSTE